MLLAWPPSEPPDVGMLRAIRTEAPHVQVAAHELPALQQQIRALLKDRVVQAEALT